MNFSQQEKINASERMQTLFNSINNEIDSALNYVGSMKKGNRNNISYDKGEFDLDADILLNIDINYYSAQEIYSDIIQIIKNNLRNHEYYQLKSASYSEIAIIHVWSKKANYTFDIAIKTNNGDILKYNCSINKFYWN